MRLRPELTALVFLLCIPMPCMAFIDQPTITPLQPTLQTPISLHVRAGGCDGFYDLSDQAELSSSGPGQLQLIVDGEASLPVGHPFCNWPTFTYRFDLGTLPPGKYTLQLMVRDELDFNEEPVLVGSTSFIVSTAFVIPAASLGTLAGLAVAMLLTTMLAWRRGSVGGVLHSRPAA
jgi:hypothetical protein